MRALDLHWVAVMGRVFVARENEQPSILTADCHLKNRSTLTRRGLAIQGTVDCFMGMHLKMREKPRRTDR